MPYIPDPNHPNVKHASTVISEIVWQYVTTHTIEEIEALKARVSRDKTFRRRLVGWSDSLQSRDAG